MMSKNEPIIYLEKRPLMVLVANRDALDILVLLKTVETAFSAVSTLLNTPEWSLSSRDLASIDADHPDLQLLRKAHAAADVLAEEVACQSKLGVVCEAEYLGFGFELVDGCQRSERLVVGHDHVWCYAGKHSWLKKKAISFYWLSSNFNLGTLRYGVSDVFSDLVYTGTVDKRSLCGGKVETWSAFQLRHLLDKLFCESLGDTLLDEEAVSTAVCVS